MDIHNFTLDITKCIILLVFGITLASIQVVLSIVFTSLSIVYISHKYIHFLKTKNQKNEKE